MDRQGVARWLADYIEAWKSYDREAIGALFSEDVSYRYHPYDEPVEGREAVVDSWLGEGHARGRLGARCAGDLRRLIRARAVEGDVAVATGSSVYTKGPAARLRRSTTTAS